MATFIAIFWSFLIIPRGLSGSFTDLLGYFTLFMPLLFLIMLYKESEDIRSNEKKLVSPVTFNFTVMIVFDFSPSFA